MDKKHTIGQLEIGLAKRCDGDFDAQSQKIVLVYPSRSNHGELRVVIMRGKCNTYSAMLKDRDYDVTPHIILILSLTLTQNARGVGEGLRGGYSRRRVRGVL